MYLNLSNDSFVIASVSTLGKTVPDGVSLILYLLGREERGSEQAVKQSQRLGRKLLFRQDGISIARVG